MLLKRKRSTDSPFTLPAPYSKAPPLEGSFTSSSTSRPILNSRTQKRHRDNRPPQETIHAQTLHKLYDAQRTQQNHEVIQVAGRQGEDRVTGVSETPTQKQKSLHSFWSLPSSATASRQMSVGGGSITDNGGDRCEDCDAPMRMASTEADGDYTMGDTGMELGTQAHLGGGTCAGCERRVCGMCSLVPRERRMCLECVGRGFE